MITSVSTGQHFVTVSGPSGTYYNNSGQPMTGMLRYHSGGKIEVYDGNHWHQVNTQCTISLSNEAETAINWAIQKMKEEKELQLRMQKYPSLQEAYKHFQTIDCLTKEEEKHNA